MYGNGYSVAVVLDHRSTATSLTGKHRPTMFHTASQAYKIGSQNTREYIINVKRFPLIKKLVSLAEICQDLLYYLIHLGSPHTNTAVGLQL